MSQLDTLLLEIVLEIKRTENLTDNQIFEEWKAYRDTPLPAMLSRGDGSGTFISPKIDQNIDKLRKEYLNLNSKLKTTYLDNELRELISRAIGLAISKIDLARSDDENIQQMRTAIEDVIQSQVQSHKNTEYTFPCTLFMRSDIPKFSIGPISFEAKHEWLNRKYKESSRNKDHEERILEALDSNQYVCSVTVKGFPPDKGLEKAFTVARFALASIALMWTTPATVLDKIYLSYDKSFYQRKILWFGGNGEIGINRSFSHNPHGLFIQSDEWENLLKEKNDYFEFCGKIFNHILNPFPSGDEVKIYDKFIYAFMWFHSACREKDTLIALVQYASCLDSLAAGGRSNGIANLIAKQLNILTNGTLFKDDLRTVTQVINDIYSKGRSRTLHGNNDKLGHDWSSTRTEAEVLARICLVSCLEDAAKT